jgi:hypothetical protein
MDFYRSDFGDGPIERVRVDSVKLDHTDRDYGDLTSVAITFTPIGDAEHADAFDAVGLIHTADTQAGVEVFIRRDPRISYFSLVEAPQPFGLIAVAASLALLGASFWRYQVLRRRKLLTSITR